MGRMTTVSKHCEKCGRLFVGRIAGRVCCGVPLCGDPDSPEVKAHTRRQEWVSEVGKVCGVNCNHWGKVRGSEGCTLIPERAAAGMPYKPCDIPYYVRKGFRCFDSPARFPSYVAHINPEVPSNFDDVQFVTVHYNPTRAARLAETYYEWRDSLGDLADRLRCYELVFDDHPGEIEGSIAMRAESSRSLMWQKEALLNRALRDCDCQYFAWLDHDICIQSPTWLVDALQLLGGEAKAVQLFSEITYLTRDYKEINTVNSRVAGGKSAPGGAWIADAEYLRSIGGFYTGCVVGASDEWTYSAMSGEFARHMTRIAERMTPQMRASLMAYFKNAHGKKSNVANIDSLAYHLWHGDRKNRQYDIRHQILDNNGFDPSKDIRERADGVLEWVSDKPKMHAEIREFFINRKDDG